MSIQIHFDHIYVEFKYQGHWVIANRTNVIFTARKRSLQRLCFYKCLSVHRGDGVGIPACLAGGIPACLAVGLLGGGVSQHALQFSRPTPGGGVEGSGLGGVSKPTPWGGLQAHTLGGLQAHAWGRVSRPTPGGCIPDPPDGYCCGWYASYWNAFLFT